MEVEAACPQPSKNHEDGGVIYLSFPYVDDIQSPVHRCRHNCNIQHVFANLYQCLTSNTTHVCDQNCSQKILYDNHTSICIVSRRIAPLTPNEHHVVRSIRRKSDGDIPEPCGRRQKSFFRSSTVPSLDPVHSSTG